MSGINFKSNANFPKISVSLDDYLMLGSVVCSEGSLLSDLNNDFALFHQDELSLLLFYFINVVLLFFFMWYIFPFLYNLSNEAFAINLSITLTIVY